MQVEGTQAATNICSSLEFCGPNKYLFWRSPNEAHGTLYHINNLGIATFKALLKRCQKDI